MQRLFTPTHGRLNKEKSEPRIGLPGAETSSCIILDKGGRISVLLIVKTTTSGSGTSNWFYQFIHLSSLFLFRSC
jgi:hypothetical protein